jgi:2-oxoglutarate ferredoxin oxidoreductase subunit delta
MAKINIDKSMCKGCGLCVKYCPAGIIVMDKEINKKGVNVAIVKDVSKCKGCAFCAIVCPDCAIEVYK